MRSLVPSAFAPALLAVAGALAASACGDSSAGPGGAGGDGGTDPAPAADGGPLDGGGTADSGSPGDGGPSDGDAPACAGKLGTPGDRTVTLMSGGISRSFLIHVPATYVAAKRTPLVFVFHGYTMSASSIATASHFATAADAHGMIAVFPSGTNASFNAGGCCGTAASTGVDDLGFAKDMIANVSTEFCIDPKRIYSTGFSNGGFFSYLAACQLSDVFAAVASVSGVIGIDPADCKPKRPVPLLHIHGTSDLVVPYNGGGIGAARSVATSVDAFKAKNTCPAGEGAAGYTKDDVACRVWAPCAAGSEVQLCTVTGGGHQWPGGDTLPYGGSASPNLNSSEAIAKFFESHPMP